MKSESSGFFWPSYVDLLTGLFIVMLILFVLSSKLLINQKEEIKLDKDKYEAQLVKIKEMQRSIKNLPTDYFTYQPVYKRHTLNRQINFAKGRSEINSTDHQYLWQVGTAINDKINSLKVQYGDSVKYLLVIEGMASRDLYTQNYELSYQRAKSVYDYWHTQGIEIDTSICEVMISGSGTGGVGRYNDPYQEELNQRILIQILPKVEINTDVIRK